MPKLILRADDLGISEGVNYGIYKAVSEGAISCVGLMSNMPTAEHGYNLVEKVCTCIGVHLNICLGNSVADFAEIPSLVNEEGLFYTSREINLREKDTVDLEECMIEIKAQIDRFEKITGKKPDYVDGHAIMSPTFFQAIKAVTEEQHLFFSMPSFDKKWENENEIYGLDFLSFNEKGLYDPREYFERNLAKMNAQYCSIAVFHPGFLDQFILDHSSYTFIRPMECEFLCSEWLKNWIEQNNIEIVDFNNYQDAKGGIHDEKNNITVCSRNVNEFIG